MTFAPPLFSSSSLRSVPLLIDQMEMRPQGSAIVDRTFFTTSYSRSPLSTPVCSALSYSKAVCFADDPSMPSTPNSSPFTSNPVFYNSDSDSETPAAPKNVDSNKNCGTPAVTESADSTEESDLIPKPDALKWTSKRWKAVQGFIRTRILATMDCSLPFLDQPLLQLQAIQDEAVTKYSFLNDYEDLWPVNDMIRSRLKYEKSCMKCKADAKLAEEAREKSKQHLTISVPASKRPHKDS
ncbi:hypothetical protein GYMLUDRAFT_244220 [Collybiopsis luxurians FD-317 M1]|uniref:Uncharacterized protein n=1 Tax=Collybiopsis luxurians FD-317 M1 TaxID=944289 RepID=A0A0D0CP81_9AGAR|nr:hypothetical protein GYMLUDRAFT_244220 [Collybiopsis luxurians FD-317 M1]